MSLGAPHANRAKLPSSSPATIAPKQTRPSSTIVRAAGGPCDRVRLHGSNGYSRSRGGAGRVNEKIDARLPGDHAGNELAKPPGLASIVPFTGVNCLFFRFNFNYPSLEQFHREQGHPPARTNTLTHMQHRWLL